MWQKERFTEIYEEIAELGKVELPNKLWEGGLSTYKLAIDTLRGNQERLSTLLIEVSREQVTARKLQKYGKKLTESGRVPRPGIPSIDDIEDYVWDITTLLESVKLIHGDLNRARSDLKSKILLLESESKMGGSGSIDRANIENSNTNGVSLPKGKVSNGDSVDWNLV